MSGNVDEPEGQGEEMRETEKALERERKRERSSPPIGPC